MTVPPALLERVVADSADRPAWRKTRERGLGASDAAKWAKVESWPLYLKAKLSDHFEGNDYTRHGNAREPVILRQYRIEQNTLMFRSASNPRFFATPDGVALDAAGKTMLAEAKTVNREMGKTPATYYRQMQWAMFVCDAERDLFVFEEHVRFQPAAMEPQSRWIYRDEACIRQLVTIAELILEGLDSAEQFRSTL
jgi:hypothetical protein